MRRLLIRNRVVLTVPTLVLLLAPILVLCQAETVSAAGDSYLDPLAYTRIDFEAGDKPLTYAVIKANYPAE